jgi:hypothetical protein
MLGALRIASWIERKKLWEGTTRILRVNRLGNSGYRHNYENIGHGWVKKLVDRHLAPDVDGELLAKKLNEACQGTSPWISGGSSGGLVAIWQTRQAQPMLPEEVADLLIKFDEGCR